MPEGDPSQPQRFGDRQVEIIARPIAWLPIGGAAAAFLATLVAIVVAANRGSLPRFVIALYAFPGGDKIGHGLLMGMLGLLVNLALAARQHGRSWRTLLVGTVSVMLLVTTEEFSQRFFGARRASWDDLLSSYAGIVPLSYAGWVWGQRILASAQLGSRHRL